MNAEELGKLYRFLREKDELKKFRKTIPKNQLTIDDAIRENKRKKK